MRKHIGYIALTMALLCGCVQNGSGVHVAENTENSSLAADGRDQEQSAERGGTAEDHGESQSAESKPDISTEEQEDGTSAEAVQLSEAEVRSWLYDKSVVVTEGLKALSGDEAYLELFLGTDELARQVLEWHEGLQEEAGEIYIIPVDSVLMKSFIGEGTDWLSTEGIAAEYLTNRLAASVGNVLNGRFGGASVLAASGAANYSATFRMDGFEAESQTWLIRYTDELGVCVAFAATGDDVLTVSASFVVWPELTEAEQQELLGDGGLEQLGIERLEASDMQQ